MCMHVRHIKETNNFNYSTDIISILKSNSKYIYINSDTLVLYTAILEKRRKYALLEKN